MSQQPPEPGPEEPPPYQQGQPYQPGPPPPYQQGQPYQQGPNDGWRPVSQDERNWAMAAHVGSFVAAYVALGFLAPLVVLLAKGNLSPYVRMHAVESLNFQISALIYAAVSLVLILVLIGVPMLIALGIFYLVTVILGTVAASAGKPYRYPLTIRFVH
ncbi:MAG: uncharacterized protein QOF57_1493 [Frankiaceae bacterium]|jgi:uncharacterized Tic20 family protein|nr:uncharacterized protein [Frankiaceae bacterium]